MRKKQELKQFDVEEKSSSTVACVASVFVEQTAKKRAFRSRSKRFRGAKSEETGFLEFCQGEKWGESKNKKEGVGEGKEETASVPLLPSPSPSLHFLRSPHFSRGQNSFARRSRWISGFSFPYISGFPKRTGTLATQASSTAFI